MEYILNKQKSHQIKNNTTTRFNYNSFFERTGGVDAPTGRLYY